MNIIYNKKAYNIELQGKDSAYSLLVDGDKVDFPVNIISDNVFNMQIENKFVNAFATQDENNCYVFIDGDTFTFSKPKEEEKCFSSEGGLSADKEIIKPPMPGCIVKVLVQKEQKVEEGTALIIVEAMKMETSLYSTISGIVTQVNVSAGEQVDSDTVLIVVEKEEK
jgi:biotin carboxyl carrier protein